MGLSMHEKKALTREVSKRYQQAQKKEKSKILDELVKTTSYNRMKHTVFLFFTSIHGNNICLDDFFDKGGRAPPQIAIFLYFNFFLLQQKIFLFVSGFSGNST